MDQPLFNQQVTFIYTTDLAAGSAFLAEKLGLELALNQNDTCHIYKVAETSFLGVCINRAPPDLDTLTRELRACRPVHEVYPITS